MHVVRQGLHVRELAIGMDHAAGITRALPGVINVYVNVARIAHSAGYQGVGRSAYVRISDPLSEMVPAIPAHGWSRGELRRLCLYNQRGDEQTCSANERKGPAFEHGFPGFSLHTARYSLSDDM